MKIAAHFSVRVKSGGGGGDGLKKEEGAEIRPWTAATHAELRAFLYLQREKADIVRRIMKKFLAIFAAAAAACACAYSQEAQNSPSAPESQAPEQAAPAPAAAADSPAASASLSPEEIEHQKMQKMRDRQALREAYTIKGKMARLMKAIIGDNEAVKNFLGQKAMGLYVGQYMLVLAILLATFVFTRYLLGYIFKLLYRTFKRGGAENFASLFFKKIKTPAITCAAIVGFYFAGVVVVSERESLTVFNRAVAVAFWVSAFWLILNVFDIFFMLAENRLGMKSASAASLINFLRKVTKSIIIIIALLSILDNIGANVNTIIASLGIGGMALAFAAQDTIANFFGSVSIIIDRPFVVGDWIKTLTYEGNVEAIGFRSTRIRTFTKTLVTIPNSILAKESVENFSKMPLRKVTDVLGLTYSATADQIEAVIPEINDAIKTTEGVDPYSVSVRFDGFGASSLNIRVVYYTKKINYDYYTDVRARVNFALMRILSERGLSFAFPSTSIYVESVPKELAER